MARYSLRLFTVLAATLCAASITAGQLSRCLADSTKTLPPDRHVSVWIQLTEIESLDAIKASVDSSAGFEQRYRSIVARLRSNHATRRQALVANLTQMRNRQLADNVRTHWLVNIVEAEIAAGELEQIGARADVVRVMPVPTVRLIAPTTVGAELGGRAGISDNLAFINADAAWAAGYTGAGRLVCSFDTGIDGDHPALSQSWKGNDGNHAAAWFDPRYDGQATPRIIPNCGYYTCNTNHGTHTMGIMVGHDDATGDTTGVAPDAKWISAAVIDITGASIIDAFEWTADPDGDPNTVADVPDVISHGWGVTDIGCQDVFYQIIDNVEALGIVNIFAAGSDGPSAATIRNPANRALDSIDCFAVGNVDARSDPPIVCNSSSRGPSDCNGAIKPNVTAPGVFIRSTWPGGGYNSMTGSAMAVSQVSGLVALLRQKNPNATVDELKIAILTSAPDFGYSLPDNDYGWGIIDCMAALNALPAIGGKPNIRVYSFDHDPTAAGDTVSGTVVLENLAATAIGVSAVIVNPDPSLEVLAGALAFGTIPQGDTLRSGNTVLVAVADTVTEGRVLAADLYVYTAGVYVDTLKLFFLIGSHPERMLATHDVGQTVFTVSNFGSFGLGDGMWFPAGGMGFRFDGSEDYMYEAGLLIGTDADHVSDGVRNAIGEPDGDFGVLPGGNIVLSEPGLAAPQQTHSRFGDERSENPIGLAIVQESFAFDAPPDDDFIILRYALTNTQPHVISGLYIGIYVDWDVINWQANAGGFNTSDEYAWTAYNSDGSMISPRGMMVLDGPLVTGFTSPGTLVSYTEDGFTEAEKYDALTNGLVSANFYVNASTDLVQMVAVGPLTLAPGDVDTVAFALLAADDLTGMTSAADRARSAYPPSCCNIRGDFDHDGEQPVDITDLLGLIDYMFQFGPEPACFEEADINGSGGPIDIADAVHLVDYMFQGGPPPVACP